MTWDHLSETQLKGYSERTLNPDELRAVDSHLASCDECHERLARTLPGAIRPIDEPFHLDYEQHLEPYVDGKADDIDREIVDSHVAVCSRCATELEDLLEFKRQPVAAIAGDTRRKQWLPKLSWLPSPAWAAAAIGVFVLGGGVFLWTRYSASRSVSQLETISTKPYIQPEQPSPAPTAQVNASPREEPLLVFNDAGGQVIVNQRGRLEGLQELPPDLKESVERALATRRLGASPALRGWTTDTLNLRSGTEASSMFGPLEPVGVVIETDRPTFRWQKLEGAQNCTVTIYDAKLRQVQSSGPLTRLEWTTPIPLARGVTYSWQISALKEGETVVSPKPPLPEARFKVLDQRAVTALAKLRESAGNSHLAMGVFYWKHGLIEEAEREFQELAKANPNSSVAKELLASIRHR